METEAATFGSGRLTVDRTIFQRPEFTRIVTFTPAFDKRDPDPKKNFGIHGVELRMVLKGPEGAIQFVVFTGWHWLTNTHGPMAADFGYHARKPQYEGHLPIGGTAFNYEKMIEIGTTDHPLQFPERVETGTFTPCEYLDGAPCYYDGSGLYAEKVFQRMIREGDDAVWQELEQAYASRFCGVVGD